MKTDSLSITFAALADPTRRAILSRLIEGDATVNELAAPHAMSLPSVSRHLKVLERAGLVVQGQVGPVAAFPTSTRRRSQRQTPGWRRTGASSRRALPASAANSRTNATRRSHDEHRQAVPRDFTLTWTLDATPADVFRAWTNPEHLQWFYNDRNPIPGTPIGLDLRVGGVWRQEMVIDASKTYITGGVYREIVPDEKLVFAWGATGGWPKSTRTGSTTARSSR